MYTRYAAFFTALFQQLLTRFQNIDHAFEKFKNNIAAKDCNSVAAKFRFLMTHNQTYTLPNYYRRMFYHQVCEQAESVSNGIYTLVYSYPVSPAAA